ncbi:uncharacterized protein DNG_04536 [Cephalotrichum gorgonifer]|uniref:Adh_short domain-containing protein n=1 Tax=Cephalotrichum gorgonifer TaxID=2041049 RepID=A0AAE8MX83_9PEZI|nr:uncharacterized protein DNG_04536 [Cephalotrichum gorgonifer]
MATYVVTGANRGIGLEFTRQFSENPANTVIGLVRDRAAGEKLIAAEIGRSNIHTLRGDLFDYDSLKACPLVTLIAAASETAKITGGKLDYLIASAAALPILGPLHLPRTVLEKDLLDCFRTNVIGQVHLFSVFLRLVRAGSAKKAIGLISGHADVELVRKYDLGMAGPYSASKSALNQVVARFSAACREEGILFMSLSPGFVATSTNQSSEEDMPKVMATLQKFQPEDSVKHMKAVIDKVSLENGDGGAFLSHLGNKTGTGETCRGEAGDWMCPAELDADGPAPGSKRKARGPGIRLSWPSRTNTRRAISAKPPSYAPSREREPCRNPDTHMVHLSYRDVEMHYHSARADQTGESPAGAAAKSDVGTSRWHVSVANSNLDYAPPVLQPALAWNPVDLEVGHKDLLQYCALTPPSSSPQRDPGSAADKTSLGRVLRLAAPDTTPSAKAVRQALLAFSSLHCHSMYTQAAELKISALRSSATASGPHISTSEAVRYVAAGMLLCSFEIHLLSRISGQWTWYLTGVKEIIKAARLDILSQDGDVAMLVDWVYYHDVLARFSSRPWHRGTEKATLFPTCVNSEASETPFFADTTRLTDGRASGMQSSALATLGLLSDICDAVLTGPQSTAPVREEDEHGAFLKILDWRIKRMPVPTATEVDPDASLTAELYRLAMLVYLNWASGDALNQASKTKKHVKQAFAIIPQLASCPRQLPVFIFGCEAHPEDQRAAVLDLIARTERRVSSRSFNYTRLLSQVVWVQDDIAGRDLNYWDKVSYVISCCTIMPAFVYGGLMIERGEYCATTH